MKLSLLLTSLAASVALLVSAPSAAQAGVEACGDFVITGETQCQVIPPGASCTTQCTPVTVEVSCAVDLQAQCSAECQGEVSVDCTGSCSSSCEAECQADPGSFDCAAYCQADCSGSCEAQCSDSQCQATCEANCSATCDADCEAVPPSASCEASCEGSCSGSCKAESSLACQTECTGSLYADCVTDVQGGCVSDCESTEGALFCDGQYVDIEGSLAGCVASLQALYDIEVEGYAEANCEGNSCTAEAGVGCSTTGQRGALGGIGFCLLALVGLTGRSKKRD